MSRPIRLLSLVGAISLVLAACQPGPATSPASTAPSGPSASPVAVATVVPTTPTDLARLLREQFAAITSGDQHLTGTLRIGDVQATFEGTQRVNGPDSMSTLATTVGGIVSTEQRAKVAGIRYVKRGDGPWLKDAPAAAQGADLHAELERAIASAVDLDAGSGSVAPHRLASTVASFDPSRFGFTSAGQATPGTGTITFRVRPDGTPVSVTIAGTWRAPSGQQKVDGSLELTLEFTRINNRPVITAPPDVWTSFTSEQLGYSLAVPANFDHVKDSGSDYFVGPTAAAGSFGVGRSPTSGFDLNVLAQGELGVWMQALGVRKGTNEAITLGGERARLLSVSGRSRDLGGKATIHQAVAVRGKHYYIVLWVGPTAGAADALTTMKQLLVTFTFTK